MADSTNVEEESVKETKDDTPEDHDSEKSPSSPLTPDSKFAPADQAQAINLKIDVLLKPAGDAPIMKKKKWAVERHKHMNWISAFIMKYLRCEPTESLFLYVNQSFAPSPDTEIGTVFDCFGSDGKLVLHYCKSQAWG